MAASIPLGRLPSGFWSVSDFDIRWEDLALCTGTQTCWNRKGTSPKHFTKLEMESCPQYAGKLKHFDFLSLELRGPGWSKKNNRSLIPLPLHFTIGTKQSGWLLLVRHSPKSGLSIRLQEREAWFIISQSMFPLLHLMFVIVFADVRPACTCLTMQTFAMKLPVQSFSPDDDARGC